MSTITLTPGAALTSSAPPSTVTAALRAAATREAQ
jgi:hypothetical protein